jgi:uncharacterized protein (TIGR00730 family)
MPHIKSICVFCGSNKGINPAYIEAAKALGQYMAAHSITYVYGGGAIGLMGVIADAVLENKGKVIGVIPKFLATKEIKHAGLTECYEVESMHERKALMYELSDAFIALPGGFGTLDELFEIITWHQLLLHRKPVSIYNIDHYFDPLLQMVETMAAQNFIPADYTDYFQAGNSLSEVMSGLNGREIKEGK